MIKFLTSAQIEEIEKTRFYISTGSVELDKVLQGGIKACQTIEFHGLPGSGKTQLCLEIMINALMSKDERLVDCNVVYVSSKKCFFPERIRKIALRHQYIINEDGARSLNPDFAIDDIMKRILYKQVFSYEEMLFVVHYLATLTAAGNNIKLIVFDTFSAHLRELKGFEKIRISYEMISNLITMSREHNIAVVFTCDVSIRYGRKNRQTNERDVTIEPCLGEPFLARMSHMVGLEKIGDLIEVSLGKDNNRKAKIYIDQDLGVVDENVYLKKKLEKCLLGQKNNE